MHIPYELLISLLSLGLAGYAVLRKPRTVTTNVTTTVKHIPTGRMFCRVCRVNHEHDADGNLNCPKKDKS